MGWVADFWDTTHCLFVGRQGEEWHSKGEKCQPGDQKVCCTCTPSSET